MALALILSKVEYALLLIAGLLWETDRSRLDVLSQRQNDMVSAILIFHLSTHRQSRSQTLQFKQIQLSQHCLNSLPPSSRLPYSRYSLRSRGHRSPCPNSTLLCTRIGLCLLIDVCFSTFSSIIPPHCIVIISSSLFVFTVPMSPLFIKGCLT